MDASSNLVGSTFLLALSSTSLLFLTPIVIGWPLALGRSLDRDASGILPGWIQLVGSDPGVLMAQRGFSPVYIGDIASLLVYYAQTLNFSRVDSLSSIFLSNMTLKWQ
jgi:hypothetical protein